MRLLVDTEDTANDNTSTSHGMPLSGTENCAQLTADMNPKPTQAADIDIIESNENIDLHVNDNDSTDIGTQTPMSKAQCCICLEVFSIRIKGDEDYEVGKTQGIFCDEGHYICVNDLDAHTLHCSSEIDIGVLSKRNGEIFCPLVGSNAYLPCKSKAYVEDDFTHLLSNEAYNKYEAAKERVEEQRLFEERTMKLKSLGKEEADEFEENELIESLSRLLPDPRQCPCCQFGPVDPFNCDNLMSHHMEKRYLNNGQSVIIDNACPECGWLGKSRSEWSRWNRQFLHRKRNIFQKHFFNIKSLFTGAIYEIYQNFANVEIFDRFQFLSSFPTNSLQIFLACYIFNSITGYFGVDGLMLISTLYNVASNLLSLLIRILLRSLFGLRLLAQDVLGAFLLLAFPRLSSQARVITSVVLLLMLLLSVTFPPFHRMFRQKYHSLLRN